MNSHLSRALIACAGLIVSVSAHASGYQGAVASVYPLYGKVYVTVSNGAYDGAATACSSKTYMFDPSTEFGKALLSVALTAKVTGALVYAAGDGVCAANGFGTTSESLIGLDLKG